MSLALEQEPEDETGENEEYIDQDAPTDEEK